MMWHEQLVPIVRSIEKWVRKSLVIDTNDF
jgi:hypothetical protein